ncbi:molybdenum cofactor guanylyltransferase [Fulvivirga maritima]|uniref:molybdenum cofactor guanylyltransferase n=1 Tax=Fulvivirga maritima TaxID=2904247 RepID=UPI001F2F9B83|nr:molybdenum cofactor guanylyltransferase [Fulvivirga maritima]UII26564.1 molybdenum cofactor guanylyltransferase [Fulvivirga maritima]
MTNSNGNTLYGLVLIGGKSSRMGTDKSLIRYHDVTQRAYVHQLLSQYCSKVFLSCNPSQRKELALPYIEDNQCEGPITGLLSAHEAYPDASWLIMACDMPYVDSTLLNILLQQRDNSKLATCFYLDNIEPLCAIWEASSFPLLKEYYQSGKRSPRRFLEGQDVKVITPSKDDKFKLRNINEG